MQLFQCTSKDQLPATAIPSLEGALDYISSPKRLQQHAAAALVGIISTFVLFIYTMYGSQQCNDRKKATHN